MADIMISKRVSQIQPSATLAIDAKAKQMKADGMDVVGFGAGEPDFDTPDMIKDAAIDSIKKGFTKYTPAPGTPALRERIARKFREENGIKVEAAQVVVSCGAKHSITNACMALLNEGDEVIIPAPYWVSYPDMVRLAGGIPVILETCEENQFRVQPEDLEKAITSKTKMFILNSPSNPTGAMYHRADLEKLASVLNKTNVVVLSDEIYEKLVYGDAEFVSYASLSDETLQKTITINGASKAYSMTGWRIGYACGPLNVMKAIASMQSHATSNPTSFAQTATVVAIESAAAEVEKMRQEFDRRRAYMVETLNKIPGIQCAMPEGAFYAFPNISGCLGKYHGSVKIEGSASFADLLLGEHMVAVVPGMAFGADQNIRLSYATGMANIEKGLVRISEFCSNLKDSAS